MGEWAEDTLNGLTCQVCGVWMPDIEDACDQGEKALQEIFDNPPGHPRTCPDCKKENIEWLSGF